MSPEDHALRDELIALLREHDSGITAVARVMNKVPMQLRRWRHRVQLEFSQQEIAAVSTPKIRVIHVTSVTATVRPAHP